VNYDILIHVDKVESGDSMSVSQTYHAITPNEKRALGLITLALIIVLLGAVFRYGPYILAITAVAYGISLAIEILFMKTRKSSLDPSWMVTPLVFVMLLPPTAPLWMVGIGAGFGTFFGKSLFGGYGKNLFNPAAVGALFLTVSFPIFMSTRWYSPVNGWFNPYAGNSVDAIASSTPLITHNQGALTASLSELLLGSTAGSIGEAFRIGVLLVGLALIVLKAIDWRFPVAFLGSFFALSSLGWLISDRVPDPVNSLFVGGVLFAAFFLVTEPVSAPKHPYSKYLYGFGVALIVYLIRNFAAFPEGIIFAVIIMNAVGTLFDPLFNKKEAIQEVQA